MDVDARLSVVVHGDEGVQAIPDAIRIYGVTHMQCTPSLAQRR